MNNVDKFMNIVAQQVENMNIVAQQVKNMNNVAGQVKNMNNVSEQVKNMNKLVQNRMILLSRSKYFTYIAKTIANKNKTQLAKYLC